MEEDGEGGWRKKRRVEHGERERERRRTMRVRRVWGGVCCAGERVKTRVCGAASPESTRVCTHRHARMHTHAHACTHMHTRAHTRMHTHTCTHARLRVLCAARDVSTGYGMARA
eukprot:944318-Rhodomonas_salina.1